MTYRDAIRAGVLDPEDIADARRTLPENKFKALYLAEADDGTGNPFGDSHIEKCIIPGLSTLPPVAYGIDLAKKQDYLVIIGLDSNGHMCRFFRWQGIAWRDSIKKIHNIVGEDVPALVDSTGVGDPVLEELKVEHGNFQGFMFSLTGKQKLMEGLAVSIQGGEIGYPDGVIVEELKTFEYHITASGNRVLYAAPEGYNDDCVCGLALARQMFTETLPGQNLIQYIRDIAGSTNAQRAERKAEENAGNTSPQSFFPQRTDVDASEQLSNELTDLYLETLNQLQPKFITHCHFCHTPVEGAFRISDGEFVWHPECI